LVDQEVIKPFSIMFSGPDCIQSHLLYVAFWYGNTQNDVSFRESSENGGILVFNVIFDLVRNFLLLC
jgi:hypothetical protein